MLSPEEQAAIIDLKLLAERWPKTLWLFAGGSGLCVMRAKSDGSWAMRGDGYDPDMIVANIDIPNDGGDF